MVTFSRQRRIWSFHVAVLQRTAKKCTKNYNARAHLLFCSLNLLLCGVLVAVAVVFCVRSPTAEREMTDVKHVGYFIFTFKCFAQTEIQFRDGFDTMKQRKMTLDYREVKYKIIFLFDVVLGVASRFLKLPNFT